MRLLFVIALVVLSTNIFAQDTITVQTLTFEDITQRRGEWVFPGEDQEFRKILMYYTLKCDEQTQQDQFDCGEWDYLTYNFVYDHTGELDSTLITHPMFYVGIETPDEFDYQPNPLYNYYESYVYTSVIDEVISETPYMVGTAITEDASPFGNEDSNFRVQYLWTADELMASGMTAGEIQRIGLEIATDETTSKHLQIRMAGTTDEELNSDIQSDLEVVYDQEVSLSLGVNQFNLLNAFEWDGTSNIAVEFTVEDDGDLAGDLMVDATDAMAGQATSWSGSNGYIEFNAGDFLKVPVSGEDFGSEITVSLWTYGDPSALPDNTYLFEAVDQTGDRSLNVHLPWSNGRVYWDAGAGSGYDRIDKAANTSDYEGQWNHWAFTKNSETGIMNIYLNGELWHTGEGFERPIGELHSFNIGKGAVSNNGYPGKIDEFRVWNKELDGATIAAWMNKSIDPSHPNYSDLNLLYDFNGMSEVSDQSGNTMDAIIFGSPVLNVQPTSEVFMNAESLTVKPVVTFSSGEYVMHTDSSLVIDSVLQSPISVVTYNAVDEVLVGLESTWYWPEGCSYWYDYMGNLTDSLCFAAENTLVNDTAEYFGPSFEVIDRWEIGRFITPYGIQLELPEDGFTWVYDVTDYAHLLRDTVDFQAGNQQELIDVQFKMITGTPPRDVLEVNKVWGDMASRSYASLDNDESLSATDVPLLPETQQLMLKTRLTGHGHNSNTGNYPHCCEWKDNTHYLYANGSEVANWHIWQTHDCALNPVYPQGGTWPGAREGWCPGDLVDENNFDLSEFAGSSSINLDYDITPVPSNNQGMGSGNYIVSMHLFQYGASNHELDAEVYNVMNPSDMQYYQRHNPICREPRVVIRNNGSETLTSAEITYNVSGGPIETYNWTGNLETMESETITLPVENVEFWEGNGDNEFLVSISAPNGNTDQYSTNNTYTSPYSPAPEYPFDFIVWFKTNNYPSQNSYTVKDIAGNVVFERDDMDASTIYRDTMDLAPGCYTLEFLDTGNDGLSYWANPAQGSGYLRFKYNGGIVFENIETEFGRSFIQAFTVGDFTSIYEQDAVEPVMAVYPNPSHGDINLELSEFEGIVNVEIFTPLGKEVISEQMTVNNFARKTYDLRQQPAGIYYLKVSNDAFQKTQKVILE